MLKMTQGWLKKGYLKKEPQREIKLILHTETTPTTWCFRPIADNWELKVKVSNANMTLHLAGFSCIVGTIDCKKKKSGQSHRDVTSEEWKFISKWVVPALAILAVHDYNLLIKDPLFVFSRSELKNNWQRGGSWVEMKWAWLNKPT